MEEQLVIGVPLVPAQQTTGTDQPLPGWPLPIQKRDKSYGHLSGISVWHDFNWRQVIGHYRTAFRNFKNLAPLMRKSCAPGKSPVLLLTIRNDIKQITEVQHEKYWVLAINVYLVLKAESALHIFGDGTDVPLISLVTNSDLLVALTTRANQDPTFRALARSTLNSSDPLDDGAKFKDALALLENCSISETNWTQLITLLHKLKETGQPRPSCGHPTTSWPSLGRCDRHSTATWFRYSHAALGP